MAADIKARKLSFNINLQDDLPELIEGDEKRIAGILICLLENSIKFTSLGSITLDVLYEDNKRLVLIVSDTGKGIPEEKISHIFNAFDTGETAYSFTRYYEGTGLGLSILARIVQAMKGTIKVTSEEGKGSQFRIEIPVQKIIKKEEPKIDFATLNALIVEDNPVNAKILSSFLKKTGIPSDVAVNGKEGVEKFSTGTFNVVFMDVQMPVMNGLEATKAIRDIEKNLKTRVPVIAVTANAKMKECIEAGMDAFIQKPFSIERLEETLKIVQSSDFFEKEPAQGPV
jgi:CheY-like chemotaxis protein